VSRRWDDDVVFKNCAKKDEDTSGGFVNDTLRSEFHRRFMSKYVR
jgi:protein CWC15